MSSMRIAVTLALAVLLCGIQPITDVVAGTASRQLSERTWKQLNKVHELMHRERYEEALAGLDRLRPRVERRPYENALLLQTYAHIHARQEHYPRAIEALQQCLSLKSLPKDATKQSLYLLAQLQLASSDYGAAAASLEQWFALEKNPAPAAHALAGTVYAYLEAWPRAVRHLRQAIELARQPDENWYRQLLAVYYDSRQYQAAVDLLQQLITGSPDDKLYLLQLSSVYHELGNDTRAVAAMELAYLRGLLTKETELLNLARYYLYVDLPYKAGQLLEQALHDGSITPGVEHWRLLIDAWIRAREMERALTATQRALDVTPNAQLHLLQAQLLAGKEQWSGVIRSIEAAFSAGQPNSPGEAHLLQGIAHYRSQQIAPAQAAFERARHFDDTRDQATRWQKNLDPERTLASRAP